jgi:choline-sulfatase
MSSKDILIFLSDQHAGYCAGYAGDRVVRTPNLDRLAASGTVFDSAYTSCPLCVPARMSLLSGQLPSKTGIFTNDDSLASGQATFLHSLGAAGYETVLCGRMHFVGLDQRHGFTKRIFGDTTSLYPIDRKSTVSDQGIYQKTRADFGCLQVIGGGNSTTLEYDRQVIKAALDYLNQEHERPQCIVVGVYAPHFPYVAPPELYQYYLDKVAYPVALSEGCNYAHPVFSHRLMDTSPETVLKARAAYWGMVEFLDGNIGLVHHAWREYLTRNGREGIFVYLSDHGDQIGERGLYGKKTFFESSARIPMIFSGAGIQAGLRLQSPVSIMDLGPTLCELVNAASLPPEQDGQSLAPQLVRRKEDYERPIWSEHVETGPGGVAVPGRMVRKGQWKYITYADYEADDLLFDLANDPDELKNVAGQYPEKARELRELVCEGWDVAQILKTYAVKGQHIQLQKEWLKHTELDQSEYWTPPLAALACPENFYSSYQSLNELPEPLRNIVVSRQSSNERSESR